MKKVLHIVLCVLMICGIIMCIFLLKTHIHTYGFRAVSCTSGLAAVRAAETAGLGAAGEYGLGTEDLRMQIVYQLARRSVVKVTVKDAAGSGIIWKIDEDIVIASNRHLLMKDVKAEVAFYNGETVNAEILGYSQQYDIGFLKIPEHAVTGKILRDIYEAVPVLYETGTKEAKDAFAENYAGAKVLQVGADIDKNTANFFVGSIRGLDFVPLFNTSVLETACFSRAGMSGGGVFDEGGRFLGMISGGEVPEDADKREAELTYSIPPALITAEYDAVADGN